MLHFVLRAVTTIAALLIPNDSPVHAQADEVRALWVVRTTLTSPAAIATMVSAAKRSGFNTLLVPVRGRSDASFQQDVEPRPVSLSAPPSFDSLATTIVRAYEVGLRRHTWSNVNLISSAAELPAARDHIIYRHPEWLMVPKALGEKLSTRDPHSPGYIGRLARYARSQTNKIEGLYLSPTTAEPSAHPTSVVRDIAQRYDIDGVHLDYLRYPTADFDYGRDDLAALRASVLPDLGLAEQRRCDASISTGERLTDTQAFPECWRGYRTARLTSLRNSLRGVVKAVKPKGYDSLTDPSRGPGYLSQVQRAAFQF